MMRSLFSGVSGLKNHQTRMDVIGNNISNVNTTGYKSARATFTDMLSQTLSGASSPTGNVGGTNPKQIGLGSSVSAIETIFTNGSVQSTGKNTDLCLSSENALFILNTGSGTAYTRNGAFEFDAEGNYVQAGTGYFVQGWMANNGAIDTGSSVGKITIPSGKSMAPKASSTAAYSNNLNSEVPTVVSISGGTGGTARTVTDPSTSVTPDAQHIVTLTYTDDSTEVVTSGTFNVGGTHTGGKTIKSISEVPIESKASVANPVAVKLSDGSTVTQTSGTYKVGHSLPVVTTLTVYDTLGAKHDVSVFLTKTGVTTDASGHTTSTWAVSLDTDHTTAGDASTQTITEADGTTTTLAMNVQELVFGDDGKYESGSGNPVLTLANGSLTPQTVALDFSAMTQYAASSTVAGLANGNAAGTLASISIDKSGTITGTYTNGVKQTEAQIALQRFTNPAGLTKVGESLYEDSNNAGKSGEPNTATAIGATITPAALEMSNVDIADQFTDMIVTQRGFQSNSKIITVSDEMLETLINMKR